MKKMRKDNHGFSLIEIIVIMAIMTVTVGAISLSVSLITGSEAKKAARKTDSMLNEVKTGAMSRYDEDFTITYKTMNTSTTPSGDPSGDIDKDGFYAVKKITTLTFSGTPSGGDHNSIRGVYPDEDVLGEENRILGDERVQITLKYMTKSGASAGPVDTKRISINGTGSGETRSATIKYDRATGKFAGIVFAGEDPIGDKEDISKREPVELIFTSGLKDYKITFNGATGRHRLETN